MVSIAARSVSLYCAHLVYPRHWTVTVHEDDCRLFNCQQCGRQRRICRRCDRGQRYCSTSCRQQARRRCVAQANARYQHSARGARVHAARQARWRARQKEKVTHHRLARPAMAEKVHAVEFLVCRDEDRADRTHSRPRCDFCQRTLGVFTRLGALRRGSHRHGWG